MKSRNDGGLSRIVAISFPLWLILVAIVLTSGGASCHRPQPTPTPTPPSCPCVVPIDDNWTLVRILDGTERFNEPTIGEGREKIGDVCGKPPGDSYAAMVQFLASKGICAGVYDEAVMVSRPDGVGFEKWHVVSGTNNNCWATLLQGYEGTWKNPGMQAACKGVR